MQADLLNQDFRHDFTQRSNHDQFCYTVAGKQALRDEIEQQMESYYAARAAGITQSVPVPTNKSGGKAVSWFGNPPALANKNKGKKIPEKVSEPETREQRLARMAQGKNATKTRKPRSKNPPTKNTGACFMPEPERVQLAAIMAEKNFTFNSLSRDLKISAQTIGSVLNGKHRTFPETIKAIADAIRNNPAIASPIKPVWPERVHYHAMAKAKGLTCPMIVKLTGWHKSTVSKYLCGSINPTVENAKKLMEIIEGYSK